MNCKHHILFLLLTGLLLVHTGCEKKWEEYYRVPDQTNIKLLDAIKENADYSDFVRYIEETGFDTLLNKSESFTLFIPTNTAFSEMNLSEDEIEWVMGYHIAKTVFIPSNINGMRKLETYIKKFALLTENENGIFFDGVELSQNSPLYKDGIYYEMNQVAYPAPNLYEYMVLENPLFATYVDSRDSVSLDYNESKPIDFDEEGNTIYDSVYFTVNRFERDFYPVTLESRDGEATLVMVAEEKYNEALDLMADNLGSSFLDHHDIPEDWQTEFLLPYIFTNGFFEKSLYYDSFLNDSLTNIQGDLIPVDNRKIDPDSRKICSNGIAFQYMDFVIPEELYLEEIKYEGEDLAVEVSGGFFAWDAEQVTTSDITLIPSIYDHASASEGKYVSIDLPRGHAETYNIEFILPKIFPRIYKLVWRGNYRPSGVIAIYVNDELMGEFDNYNFRKPVNGSNPVNGFNKIEFLVENITSYSNVTIKMEYYDPGLGTLNGLNIDYVSLIPVAK